MCPAPFFVFAQYDFAYLFLTVMQACNELNQTWMESGNYYTFLFMVTRALFLRFVCVYQLRRNARCTVYGLHV